jgi:tetratricopeptide (TPR) repeat protein
LETMRNNGPKALAAFQKAVDVSQELRAAEPGNTLWRQFEVKRRYELGFAAALFGRTDHALVQAQTARRLLDGLIAKDATNDIWTIDLSAQLDELEARLLAGSGRYREAIQRTDAAIARLSRRTDMNDPMIRAVFASVLLIRGDMRARTKQPVEAREDWRAADRLIVGEDQGLQSSLLSLRFAAAKRLGEAARAQSVRTLIDRRGWQHPSYLLELR